MFFFKLSVVKSEIINAFLEGCLKHSLKKTQKILRSKHLRVEMCFEGKKNFLERQNLSVTFDMAAKEVVFYFIGICCGFLLFTNYFLEVEFQTQRNIPKLKKIDDVAEKLSSSNRKCLADDLFESVKVLCLVLTYPANHKKKARHVMNTWGKRCNKILFITLEAEPGLPTILVDVPNGRDYLWDKMREGLKYAYEHHLDEFDWFMKADDDT